MRLVRSWWAAASGNVGLAFAMTMIPLCTVLGLAVDYLRASNLRLDLQSVADAAVLAAGAKGGSDEAELRHTISLYMDVNLPSADKAALGAVRITFGKPATIRLVAEAASQNALLKLVGIDRTPIAIVSEAVRANPLEVALVLDNTGSMAGTREAALRKAVKELAETLMIDLAAVNVAVVPFSQYVNVGAQYRTARWLQWVEPPADQRWDGCVRSRPPPLDVSDGLPQVPYPILSRFVGDSSLCPSALTPLTSDKSMVMTAVETMAMSGRQTYVPAGLMWGWNALSPDPPLTDAKSRGVRKAMVLMTDGENTASAVAGGFHLPDVRNPTSTVQAMMTLCGNIKQAGIHLYTVAFEVVDRKTIDLLADCASDGQSAFAAENSADFLQAFREITRRLQQLRLSE